QEVRDLHSSMRQMARRIKSAQQSLRRYVGRVTSAQEEERRRLARDLHDETIQDLIALDQKVQLAAAEAGSRRGRTVEALQRIHRDAGEAIQRVRRLSLALRPGYLEDLGLCPALEALVGDVGSKTGLPIDLKIAGQRKSLAPDVELALYRIVQESLANITRHAHARSAGVEIRFAPASLALTIWDDGVGFAASADAGDLTTSGHFGLVGMHERAQAIGASLDVRSRPGKGTRLTLRMPLR
ncbi:MAG TPA: sensor histidine kinase, partial [Spirochaetia bacterium]